VVRLRLIAIIEILVCSGFPTQLAIAAALSVAGVGPFDAHGQLAARYVFAVSIIDAAAVVGLVAWFLHVHGEQFTHVMLGNRPVAREMRLGLLQVPVVFLIVVAAMLTIGHVVPWLHNVTRNPFEGLIRSPAEAALFSLVALLGGGVREEVQRAFILHRFDQHLGGGTVGLAISSLAFGLGHVIQGRDVAVTTMLLGAFWGLVYLKRRSIGSTVVSHAGFDAAEIFRYVFYGA
jgi:membrane protease YdiL (CAAX protease family)